METYSHTVNPANPKGVFPPKAGVYAVREGPIMAQNMVNYALGTNVRPM